MRKRMLFGLKVLLTGVSLRISHRGGTVLNTGKAQFAGEKVLFWGLWPKRITYEWHIVRKMDCLESMYGLHVI